MKFFNFQHPKQKIYLGTYFGRTVFHLLRKLVGNQYPDVLRILVPPEILVPLEISAQFERHCLFSTEQFSRSHTQKRFWHIWFSENLKFSKKLAQNNYICVGSSNISSVADILVLSWNFWKDLRTIA